MAPSEAWRGFWFGQGSGLGREWQEMSRQTRLGLQGLEGDLTLTPGAAESLGGVLTGVAMCHTGV